MIAFTSTRPMVTRMLGGKIEGNGSRAAIGTSSHVGPLSSEREAISLGLEGPDSILWFSRCMLVSLPGAMLSTDCLCVAIGTAGKGGTP